MSIPRHIGFAAKSKMASNLQDNCDQETPGSSHQTQGVLKDSVDSDSKRSPSASTKEYQEDAPTPISMPQPSFPDLPNYWAYPDIHHAPKPISAVHCQQKGGVHISWFHYCFLCFAILCMAVVLTLFTAVALHRSDPMFALKEFRAPVPMQNFQQVGKIATPEINFSPSIVCAPPAAEDENLKFLVTRRIPVTIVETVTATVILPTSSQPTTVSEVETVSLSTIQCPLPSTATITATLDCLATSVFSTITEQTLIPGPTTTLYSTITEQITPSPLNLTVTMQSLPKTLTATASIPTTLIDTSTVTERPPPIVSSTTLTTLIPATKNQPDPTTRYFHGPP